MNLILKSKTNAVHSLKLYTIINIHFALNNISKFMESYVLRWS